MLLRSNVSKIFPEAYLCRKRNSYRHARAEEMPHCSGRDLHLVETRDRLSLSAVRIQAECRGFRAGGPPIEEQR